MSSPTPETPKSDAPPQQEPQAPQQSAPTAIAVQQRYPMREMLTILKDMGDPALFEAFAKDIVEREVAQALFMQDHQLARVFAMSGEFDGLKDKQPEQAVATAMSKIQLGRSWHMEPADAMQHVFFTNGKPSVQNEFIASRMRDSGIDWEIEWHRDAKGECVGCTLWPKRLQTDSTWAPIMERVNGKTVPSSIAFTKKNADMALVWEKGKQIRLSEKWNFVSWAEDMYYWRCIARLRRRYAPNILSGIPMRAEAEDAIPEPKHIGGAESDGVESTAAREVRLMRKMEHQADKASAAVDDVAKGQPPTSGDGSNSEPQQEPKPSGINPPWPTIAVMKTAFEMLKKQIGDDTAFWEALNGAENLDAIVLNSPESVAAFDKIQDLIAAKAPAEQAELQTDQSGFVFGRGGKK